MKYVDHALLKDKVVLAWADRYPDDHKPIEVTEIVDKAFGGSLVAIRSKDANGAQNEEMVYVGEAEAKIFYNTDEMVRFLEQKSKCIFVDILSDSSFIVGFVFIMLIILIFM
jgi:hypothetical protein